MDNYHGRKQGITATFTDFHRRRPLPASVKILKPGSALGQVVGNHAEWYDSGAGPVVNSGIGLVRSIGLAPACAIFTWIEYPFDWNDPAFESITFNMDYQTDASGYFDDDRVGLDDYRFRCNLRQLLRRPVRYCTAQCGDGGLVTYWRDDGDVRIQTPIVPLGALSSSTWYRLEATITKLTATSARIDVPAWSNWMEAVLSHARSILLAPSMTPAPGQTACLIYPYFEAASMWPAYKNYSNATGSADNACFDLSTGHFAFVVTTDLHTSDTYYNNNIASRIGQIQYWIDNPTTSMPAPEFMVITGDFPNLSETQEIIDDELGTGFLWYPVIGNHEISDNISNFNAIRDTIVPSLPYIVNHGPTGSVNTTILHGITRSRTLSRSQSLLGWRLRRPHHWWGHTTCPEHLDRQ